MTAVLALLFWLSAALLLWTYIGYPLFMFLMSKIRPFVVREDPFLRPTLTILIPAYNEADVIRRKLENTLSLDYPKDKLQILVVDDGSTDGTPDIVREFASRGVTLIQQPMRGGKVAGLNRGFENATGEIVVMSDASPNYDKDALKILMRRFADTQVGVVVGELLLWDTKTAVAKPAGLYWKYESALRKWESATGSTVAVHGNMFAIRRKLYHGLGVGTVNDEFTMAMETIRQGYRVVYEPKALSYDEPSVKMEDEFKRRARINAGRYQALFSAGYLNAPNFDLKFRLFSHKLLRPLTPIFMLIALITNIVILVISPELLWAWFTLAGQILLYGAALLGMIAEQNGHKIKVLNVPYYFVSSNFAALVGFWRWVHGTQRVTWQKRSVNETTPAVEANK